MEPFVAGHPCEDTNLVVGDAQWSESRKKVNMCKKIEDWLVSRMGFRIFMIAVIVVIAVAVAINVHFLISRGDDVDVTDWTRIHSSDKWTSSLAVSPKIINGADKTKILIWDPPTGSSSLHTSRFFNHFAQRVHFLRQEQCPVLKECAFASHKGKLSKADAVVVVGGRKNSLEELLNATLKFGGRSNRITSTKELLEQKFVARLVRDPVDRRRLTNGLNNDANFIISYLPGSEIPLIEYKFEIRNRPLFGYVEKDYSSSNIWRSKKARREAQVIGNKTRSVKTGSPIMENKLPKAVVILPK